MSRRKLQREHFILVFSVFGRRSCDFVQTPPGRVGHCSVFIHIYMYINEACACLKEACTVVLHSGLCPYITPSPPPPPPSSIKSEPVTRSGPSHAPLPSAPSTCLGSEGSCAPPGGLLTCSRDSNRPYSNIHRHPGHRGFWISKPRRQKDIFHYRT